MKSEVQYVVVRTYLIKIRLYNIIWVFSNRDVCELEEHLCGQDENLSEL